MTREAVEAALRPVGRGGYKTLGKVGVGVAATMMRVGPASFEHAGLLYRWKREIRLFEMRTHCDVRDGSAREGFVWVEPRMPSERARLVATKCRLVCELAKRNDVPYGFRYERSSFDNQGVLRLGPTEIGLTCSTIVAAVFESEGFRLLDPMTWPGCDEEDKRARRAVIANVRQKSAEHAAAMEAELDSPRIRPFEVVAAAAVAPPPADFNQAVDGGAVVAERVPESTMPA